MQEALRPPTALNIDDDRLPADSRCVLTMVTHRDVHLDGEHVLYIKGFIESANPFEDDNVFASKSEDVFEEKAHRMPVEVRLYLPRYGFCSRWAERYFDELEELLGCGCKSAEDAAAYDCKCRFDPRFFEPVTMMGPGMQRGLALTDGQYVPSVLHYIIVRRPTPSLDKKDGPVESSETAPNDSPVDAGSQENVRLVGGKSYGKFEPSTGSPERGVRRPAPKLVRSQRHFVEKKPGTPQMPARPAPTHSKHLSLGDTAAELRSMLQTPSPKVTPGYTWRHTPDSSYASAMMELERKAHDICEGNLKAPLLDPMEGVTPTEVGTLEREEGPFYVIGLS